MIIGKYCTLINCRLFFIKPFNKSRLEANSSFIPHYRVAQQHAGSSSFCYACTTILNDGVWRMS